MNDYEATKAHFAAEGIPWVLTDGNPVTEAEFESSISADLDEVVSLLKAEEVDVTADELRRHARWILSYLDDVSLQQTIGWVVGDWLGDRSSLVALGDRIKRIAKSPSETDWILPAESRRLRAAQLAAGHTSPGWQP